MTLIKKLVSQFHHPRGLLGFVAGQIMSHRQSNLARNRWSVDLLNLTGDEHVLELGPGPGITLKYLLRSLPNGAVVGLDHSSAMLRMCKRNNRQAVIEGRLTLIQGSFTDLPILPGPFHRILAVNSLQFDGMHAETLSQIADYLAPNGILAITFQPRGANPTEEQSRHFAKRVIELMKSVGLQEVHCEGLSLQPISAMCVLGQKTNRPN
jgi:trans-aconitate methyltransferase